MPSSPGAVSAHSPDDIGHFASNGPQQFDDAVHRTRHYILQPLKWTLPLPVRPSSPERLPHRSMRRCTRPTAGSDTDRIGTLPSLIDVATILDSPQERGTPRAGMGGTTAEDRLDPDRFRRGSVHSLINLRHVDGGLTPTGDASTSFEGGSAEVVRSSPVPVSLDAPGGGIAVSGAKTCGPVC